MPLSTASAPGMSTDPTIMTPLANPWALAKFAAS